MPKEKTIVVPKRFEMIGNIAIVSIPSSLTDYQQQIAGIMLCRHRKIKTVLGRLNGRSNLHRIARFTVISGNSTETIHREYGFSYKLDLSEVFFTSRLASEHKRVADQVLSGEHIFVPFAGVGPFVIPVASRGARVVAIEKNPAAIRWLSENIQFNRVEDKITIIPGDAFNTSLINGHLFDRIIIPAPYGMDRIFWVLAPFLKHGGIMHIYTFTNHTGIISLKEQFEDKGFTVNWYRKCGNIAPGIYRWVFDLVKGRTLGYSE